MSKNPKIVVFKLKELIYTGIFILLGILLIILFVWMFKSGKSKDTTTSNAPVNNTSEYSDRQSTDNQASDNSTENSSANENATTNNPTTDNTNNDSNDNATKHTTDNTSDNMTVRDNSSSKKTSDKKYSPGVYTSSLMLNNSALEIEVCVDSDKINSMTIKNMDSAITTMYPLIENAMKDIEHQIVSSQSLQNITYTDDCKYTYLILLDGITSALSKAETK